MITLEVGKYYRARDGVIFGPISYRSDGSINYPFGLGEYSWTEHGSYSMGTKNHLFDLIEEVSIYPAQPYKYGEMIEVSDSGVSWVKSRFLILNSKGFAVTENEKNMSVSWLHHRPIQPVLSREEVIDLLRSHEPTPYIKRAIELLEETK
jgi:hypothetical protein